MSFPAQPGPASHNQEPRGSQGKDKTYSVTGINLKAMPMGETDRLMTILTPEKGLIRAIAPGARKHHSRLSGRSSIFVINHLMLVRGKSLDRIAQAETQYSFPGLAKDLGKLTAAQYLAEIVLYQGLSDERQADLYYLLQEHLERIEAEAAEQVLARLCQAIFHLLSLAGLAPQSHRCCASREPIQPQLQDRGWFAQLGIRAGGLVQIESVEEVRGPKLNALEVSIFQHLAESDLPEIDAILEEKVTASRVSERITCPAEYRSPWLAIERALRQYIQYHFDRTIRSATLIDSYFS